MKKKIFLLACILIVTIIFFVYLFTPVKEDYKVGVILPLSGNMAKAGVDAKTALEIAQEDFTNIKIDLIFEDDGFFPAQSVTVFNNLIQKDVVGIIGPLNGSSIESIRSIAVESYTPVFTPWGAGNSIGPYVFKNSVEASDEAIAVSKKIQSMGYIRPAILYLQTDYGLMNLVSFKEEVNKFGNLIAEEPFAFNETDFRQVLLKIKSSNPDSIYIVGSGAGVGRVTKQATEMGFKVPFFGAYATESSDLIATGGESLEGLIYSFPFNDSNLSDKQIKFIEKFKQKIGNNPQIVSFNIYDIYELFSKAISECGKDKVCINNYFSQIKEYDGLGGKISIVNNKLKRNFSFKVIMGGEFVGLK